MCPRGPAAVKVSPYAVAQRRRFEDPDERARTSESTRAGMTQDVCEHLHLMKTSPAEKIRAAASATVHGHRAKKTPTYGTWSSMRARCNNPNAKNYRWYGAKGVKVCSRWNSFANFLEDMGERPVGHTLHRFDHDGNYCPENCAWRKDGTH